MEGRQYPDFTPYMQPAGLMVNPIESDTDRLASRVKRLEETIIALTQRIDNLETLK